LFALIRINALRLARRYAAAKPGRGHHPVTATRHSIVIQLLHWSIALGILSSYIMGLVMEDLPRGAPRNLMTMLHVSLGLLGVALTVLLALWRLVIPGLPPLEGGVAMQRLASLGHGALYAAMLAVPLLGLAMMWELGREVSVFGLFTLPSPLIADRVLGRQMEGLHEFGAHALLALAGLHAAAALFHQFVLRDGGLQRMLPATGPLRFPRA
jgi:cytochrome b561